MPEQQPERRLPRRIARATRNVAVSRDLQFQLVNDGYAQTHRSAATEAPPDWARWRGLIFAFTTEPAVVVISAERFAGLPVPAARLERIALLCDNPDRVRGAVGAYDVRESGLGYLFATLEARATDADWRLPEVMGRLDPELYCCSSEMIDDVASDRAAVAVRDATRDRAPRARCDSRGCGQGVWPMVAAPRN